MVIPLIVVCKIDALTKLKTSEESNAALEGKIMQLTSMLKKYTDNRTALKERLTTLTAQNKALKQKLDTGK